MASVRVLGAQGHAGRAAVARLEALGHGVAAEGDDAVTALLDLRPPGPRRRARWAAAAEAGTHVVAASLDPDDVVWARDAWGSAAEDRGVALLPCAGAGAVLGDLLGGVAGGASGGAQEVHTAHLVVERGGLLGTGTAGLRAEVAALVGREVLVRDGGALVAEPLAERRRLAWFARPVGPHHAATVSAPEVVTLGWHQREASLVTGQLAMTGMRAELVQGLGNLSANSDRAARWLAGRVARPGRRRPVEGGPRWASVGEALGPLGVARAWANGRDLQRLTGETSALLVDRILATSARGVLAPSQIAPAVDLLDALAEATDLRWAVVRPEVPEPSPLGDDA